MARSWFIDYLDGWQCQVDEIEGEPDKLTLTVTNEYGRSWSNQRQTSIDGALDLCWRVRTECESEQDRLLADALINPSLNVGI